MFDGGELGGELTDDPVKSRRVVESLLEPFLKPEAPTQGRMRIVEAHDDVANRVFSVSKSQDCTPAIAGLTGLPDMHAR